MESAPLGVCSRLDGPIWLHGIGALAGVAKGPIRPNVSLFGLLRTASSERDMAVDVLCGPSVVLVDG
jgi:hypothetical protein